MYVALARYYLCQYQCPSRLLHPSKSRCSPMRALHVVFPEDYRILTTFCIMHSFYLFFFFFNKNAVGCLLTTAKCRVRVADKIDEIYCPHGASFVAERRRTISQYMECQIVISAMEKNKAGKGGVRSRLQF